MGQIKYSIIWLLLFVPFMLCALIGLICYIVPGAVSEYIGHRALLAMGKLNDIRRKFL